MSQGRHFGAADSIRDRETRAADVLDFPPAAPCVRGIHVSADPSLDDLEALLGYAFGDRELLRAALTHRSFANEQGPSATDNERLEFLGDAVLDLCVGHLLMQLCPELDEGALSVTRSQVVSEAGLAAVARDLDLGRYLYVGKGEDRSGGRDKPSILSGAFEAVIAAVYLDGGFDAAWALVARFFARRLEALDLGSSGDFKTRLQEVAQARHRATPTYAVVGESGPDHDKTFEVAVMIGVRELARARGKSKKAAEQRSAAAALALLESGAPGSPLGDG
jgi:ribonuclease III